MTWIRSHWLPLLLLAAIIIAPLATFSANNKESESRDHKQHVQLVEGCKRSNENKALDINFKLDASAARREDGNDETARRYAAEARGQALTIPVPNGVEPGDARVYAIHFVVEQGRYVARLTPEAARLQAAGCERANS